MIEPPPPHDVDWPQLLDFAERVGVRVWRFDQRRERFVVIVSIEDIEDAR